MLNLLEDYISCSLPVTGDFSTREGLRMKVDERGCFRPFFGNTVVFLMEEKVRQQLTVLQDELYEKAGDVLAARLNEDTFHMTLHDLINGPEKDEKLLRQMAVAEREAKTLLHRWQDRGPLYMRATWLFNMVNTSIVLGLAPCDAQSTQRLSDMYGALENVVPLGYALTPHITMAYFRPGVYSQQQLEGLRAALQPVQLEMELSMDRLVYQTFENMNDYR